MVGAIAVLQRSNGSIGSARIGLVNVGSTPVRAAAAEAALAGAEASPDAVAAAAESATEGITPTTDIHASAEYRAHLAQVLTRRAVVAAVGM